MNRLLFLRNFDALDFFELLDAALDLLGLRCLVAEAVDEGLQMLDVLALPAVGSFKLRAPLVLMLQIFLVVPGIKMQALVPYLDNLVDRHIEKIAVVRDEDEAIRIRT